MNRRLGVTGLALAFTFAGCTPAPSALVVSGTVEDRLESVVVPSVSIPAVNLDAGFTTLSGATNPVTGRTSPSLSSVGSSYGFGTFVRLAKVTVAVGDTVTAGQSLGRIDTGVLVAQESAAKADAAVAAAQVGLLGDAIDTTYDKQADVKDAKAKVLDAINKIHDGRAKLLKARSSAKGIRARLVKQLHTMEDLLAHYPAVTPPPPVPVIPPKADLPGIIAGLKTGIKKIDVGVRKINRILRTLSKGLKKANSGLRKLNDATAKIIDARGSLRDLQELAALQADALTVPISLAKAQVTLAGLTAPVDGVVVAVLPSGSVLAPGATAVSIRETRPSTVTAWLAPAELARVCTGDSATILGDWMTQGVRATLTRIGTRSDYPPTSVATDEIHLTRAVEVEFTATQQLPAGVPVELTINSCHPAAGNTDTDR